MMNDCVLKSPISSAILTFYDRDVEYFTVMYANPSVKLKKRVWGYTDCNLLIDLFMSIASEWRGWKGIKQWASIEGDFSISATCDSLGHVMLNIILVEFDGPEPWMSEVQLGLEPSQTDDIAKSIKVFFEN